MQLTLSWRKAWRYGGGGAIGGAIGGVVGRRREGGERLGKTMVEALWATERSLVGGRREVAEKPSIALSIATSLSGGRMSTRRGSTDVHEFDGIFLGFQAYYRVTSVIGHVFSVDFPSKYQDWGGTDPLDLFNVAVQKTESNPK
ncbi:hypothetical protein GIB67_023777, partial [Kingdonia uniflora]